MDHVLERESPQVVPSVSQTLKGVVVGVDEHPLRIVQVDHLELTVEHGLVPLLRLPKRLFRLVAFGGVPQYHGEAGGVSPGVLDYGTAELRGELGAIGFQDGILAAHDATLFQGPGQVGQPSFKVLRGEERQGAPAEHLFSGGETLQVEEAAVDHGIAGVQVNQGDAVGEGVEKVLQLPFDLLVARR